ncbi:MAG: TetR/AcrR family transcriptional regulator [Candidatus Nanopelagicales bacterium]
MTSSRESSTRADRREEILAVAAQLFARDGFHGVSIDELGAALGISGPALYRYFPGKESILSAMLVDISQRLLEGGRERADSLDGLIAFHVDFALDHPDLIDVQARDLAAVPEEDRRAVRRYQAQYVDLWVRAVMATRPDLSEERARAAVHAAFGLINSTPPSARLSRPEMTTLLRGMARACLAQAPAGE